MIKTLINSVLFFIPRFYREDYAVILDRDGSITQVVSPKSLLVDSDVYDRIVTLEGVKWMIFVFFPRHIKDV